MLFHMLKKDFMKRKSVNSILFIFITLATVFLASSVNNILATASAIDYYLDYANISDIQVILSSDKESNDVKTWLDEQQKTDKISSYEQESMISLPDKSLTLADGSVFDGKGASLFLSRSDSEHNKVFDVNGNPIHLQEGEIAVSRVSLSRNELSLGDELIVNMNQKETRFTIKYEVKDAAYGSEMIGMLRFTLSDEDYNTFQKDANFLVVNNIMCKDVAVLQQEMSNEPFTTILNFVDRDMYALVYSFDLIMAALLILIGVCLILIALLVLRFTLIFTMEEEYQEIGVLKAVGLRNWTIKKLYLMKYFILVCCGALFGLFLSFPVSDFMVSSIGKNLIMQDSKENYVVNIACALFIIVLVLWFCYFCTHKLNKVSAINAIRGGSSGERFKNKRGIALAKRKGMKVIVYLGINDIFSNLKRYAVLIITFCISFILITIPLNTVNTMKSDEMAAKFAVKPNTSILLNSIELDSEDKYTKVASIDEGMKRIKQEMRDAGFEARLTSVPLYFFKFTAQGKLENVNLMTLQIRGDYVDYLQYSEGSAPILENEVAVSQQVLKDNGWEIGDRLTIQLMSGEKELIITGSYSDYMQIGRSIRLNPLVSLDEETMFDYSVIMVDFNEDKSQEEWKQMMSERFPDYKWSTTTEYVDTNVGGIQDMVNQILFPMTSMLCGVIMLITLLMERLFITREKGEIAMLKSIGFNRKAIIGWQVIRMSFVVFVSMMISIPLSLLSNQYVLKPIFMIMGADMIIEVDTLMAYIVYPGILLVGIILATFFATNNIRNINIREMNNVE